MTNFSIRVDLSRLIPANSPFNAQVLPNLAFAVQALTNTAEAQWKRFASGAPLPSGRSIGVRSGEYLRSIAQRSDGDFSREVYSEIAYAEAIERGAPARDLHDLLRQSLKVRISNKTGKRYLIIPFRHSANPNNVMRDNVIPPSIVEWWKNKLPSSVVHVDTRPVHSDIKGVVQPQHAIYRPDRGLLLTPMRYYEWGDRLTRLDIEVRKMSAEQVRRMSGMVNFRKPGASGGAAHSQFVTFRTMTEGSPGWRLKPREGYWPARTTAELLKPVAETLFTRAMEEDVRNALHGS